MQDQITIIRPDDWHIHLRDGVALQQTVKDAASQFARAIVMPNLVPPVKNAQQARDYQQRILAAIPSGKQFEPLMTLYLTDNTTIEDIKTAKASGIVYAAKLYPAGATTNSDSGVTSLEVIYPILECMAEQGLPLLLHGEITRPEIDIFDREKYFIDEHLTKLVKHFPDLKIVLEHITTQDAVEFVKQTANNIAATITAHHLLYNRNHMLVGGIRPHYYCLPILKRNSHQQALIAAATSGNPKFFLGTDSAPHATQTKEATCGCAGCYTAFAAIELYTEAFDQADALDKLENFTSRFGPNFYNLPVNSDTITLIRKKWTAPSSLPFGDNQLTPLRAGEAIHWQYLNENNNGK
ncbi:dihydroorotase [Entomomonas asaccharolytica]|uniref:Dihydroorotase n=1 Tax=Entomomonas asaccharolytica TaxID=2785331 RepID=A0A974RVV5_9GAMM|nr:dihydroorotase [Entomomonas asaccharolytica]QQP84442.1 dihydroorotase [Entomomonas asaccharolytica]